MRGARAVQESIITKYSNADLSISLVWIDMLPEDSKEKAKLEAGNFRDPRVHHFYDPHKRSGAAIADSLGYKDRVAWDIYLFYTAGAEWSETPPAPTAWTHQLSETWIDRGHYHKGDDLVRELSRTMEKFFTP